MPNKLLGPKLKAADMEHASIQIHTDRTMLGPWAEREGAGLTMIEGPRII